MTPRFGIWYSIQLSYGRRLSQAKGPRAKASRPINPQWPALLQSPAHRCRARRGPVPRPRDAHHHRSGHRQQPRVPVEAQAGIQQLQVAVEPVDGPGGRIRRRCRVGHLHRVPPLVAGGAPEGIAQGAGEAKRWLGELLAEGRVAVAIGLGFRVHRRPRQQGIHVLAQFLELLAADGALEDVEAVLPVRLGDFREQLAVVIDGEVIIAPTLREPILEGNISISGDFSALDNFFLFSS